MSLPQPTDRRRRGDYPTPIELVERVVDAVIPPVRPGQRVTILDPACGDGRFLRVAAERVMAAGGRPVVHGVDVDPGAAAAARVDLADLDASIEVGDALARDWGGAVFDVVVGNPPFLSQLAAATARGGASRHGGGPYADVAAEFLALAVSLARPAGGRVGLVLPQSILGSRDAGSIRAAVAAQADLTWSWWSPRRQFDAAVLVCALGFERHGNRPARTGDRHPVWTDVILRAIGVPDVPPVYSRGTVGDHCRLTANFRDQYYALVPAVADDAAGPLFVTSALIDPNHCAWGEREVLFRRRRFLRPRVDVCRLDARMRRWAEDLAVPKVLVANQTRVVECVVDRDGSLLPGVPVITARPTLLGDLDAIAAVLSSPFAVAWLWHATAGTGLSARTMRLRPDLLAAVPWPAGQLDAAGEAWRAGDLGATAAAVHHAYGVDVETATDLTSWWEAWRPTRRPRQSVAA